MKQDSSTLHNEAQVLRCIHKDLRGALTVYRRAYHAAEQEGDRFLVFHNQVHAASCLQALGDLEAAAQELVPAFAAGDQLPVHDEIADACSTLIDIQLQIPTDLHRIRRMIQRLEHQEDAVGRNGERRLLGSALQYKATIAELQGSWRDALALRLEALAKAEPEYRVSLLLELPRLCARLGEFDRAAIYLDDWRRLEREPKKQTVVHREDRVGFLLAKSNVAQAQRRYEEALSHAEAAVALVEEDEEENRRDWVLLAVIAAALQCRLVERARDAATTLIAQRRSQSLLMRFHAYCAIGDIHLGACLIELGLQPPDYEFREDWNEDQRVVCSRAWRLYARAAKLARTLDDRLETNRYGRAVRRRTEALCPPMT